PLVVAPPRRRAAAGAQGLPEVPRALRSRRASLDPVRPRAPRHRAVYALQGSGLRRVPLHRDEGARVAAPTLVERTPPDAEGRVAVRDQEMLVGFVGLAALLADLARQPLRDDEAERRRE